MNNNLKIIFLVLKLIICKQKYVISENFDDNSSTIYFLLGLIVTLPIEHLRRWNKVLFYVSLILPQIYLSVSILGLSQRLQTINLSIIEKVKEYLKKDI